MVLCLSLKSQGLVFFIWSVARKRSLRKNSSYSLIKINSYTVLLSFNPMYFYYVMLVLCFESDLMGESRV